MLGREKDFEQWHRVKTGLDARRRSPTFQERQIWWCSLGVNIGHEEDGKGDYATRPVLIVRKFNRRIFWGVPLTTQIKDRLHYHRVHFKGVEQCVMLSQMRLWEARRLRSEMGQLPEDQFEGIREALKALLSN
jgi:mRNA interferase MazF